MSRPRKWHPFHLEKKRRPPVPRQRPSIPQGLILDEIKPRQIQKIRKDPEVGDICHFEFDGRRQILVDSEKDSSMPGQILAIRPVKIHALGIVTQVRPQGGILFDLTHERIRCLTPNETPKSQNYAKVAPREIVDPQSISVVKIKQR